MQREDVEGDRRRVSVAGFRQLVRILAFTRPYAGVFVLGIASLLISSFLLLSFPYLFGMMTDVATGQQPGFPVTINQLALILLLILVVLGLLSYLRIYTFAQVSERSFGDIRRKLYEKLIYQTVSFFDGHRTGELMSRVTSDVATLQEMVSFTLAEFVRQVITMVAGVVIIFLITPKLAGFMMLTIPVLIVFALLFGRGIRRLSRRTQDKLAEVNALAEETFQSIRVVKAFANEWVQIGRFGEAISRLVTSAIHTARFRGLFVSMIIFILFGGMVGVGWYGATLILRSEMDSGDLISFILYTAFIGGSMAGLGEIFSQVQRAMGASERVLAWLENDDEEIKAVHSITNFRAQGEIRFGNVTFCYPSRPDQLVLREVDFVIKPGEKVALVGRSGSGKSTIINLLLRFYSPSSGTIGLDGVDAGSYDLQDYRRQFGIVPQEVVLFGGTIKENIEYGKPGATEEEIWIAAEKANAAEFIRGFKEGMNTVVGDRGTQLSGGQRQRIAIARAILKDPAVLILDEATSSLDAESEWLVQQALDTLMEGRTTLVIAHRLSTIRRAQSILVMHDGAIIERGSHMELSARDAGVYANLLQLQLQD